METLIKNRLSFDGLERYEMRIIVFAIFYQESFQVDLFKVDTVLVY